MNNHSFRNNKTSCLKPRDQVNMLLSYPITMTLMKQSSSISSSVAVKTLNVEKHGSILAGWYYYIYLFFHSKKMTEMMMCQHAKHRSYWNVLAWRLTFFLIFRRTFPPTGVDVFAKNIFSFLSYNICRYKSILCSFYCIYIYQIFYSNLII